MSLTQRQQQVKDAFIRTHRTCDARWESLLRLDAEFVDGYLRFSSVAVRQRHLAPKVQAFVALTACTAATHLYLPGIRQHVEAALVHGATREELVEVLELASTIGIHGAIEAAPIVEAALARRHDG